VSRQYSLSSIILSNSLVLTSHLVQDHPDLFWTCLGFFKLGAGEKKNEQTSLKQIRN